jgi:hypothetical protein
MEQIIRIKHTSSTPQQSNFVQNRPGTKWRLRNVSSINSPQFTPHDRVRSSAEVTLLTVTSILTRMTFYNKFLQIGFLQTITW